MYSLQSDFRDGDNVVTTMMEHNSNFVPWYALCREILPRFGRRVECRVARFDHRTGELDLDHLAELVDARTKLVCVTGASNFLGTKPPLPLVRAIADRSGYVQPSGEVGSLLLVDAAQLAPSTSVDVQALDVDYLAFSFHKLLAPFGVGVLYAKEHLLDAGPAVPLRRRHDRRGTGRAGSRGLQRPAVEVRGRNPEHPRRDRLRAGVAPRARPCRGRAPLVRNLAADPARGGRVLDEPRRPAHCRDDRARSGCGARHRRAHRVRTGSRHAALSRCSPST